MAEPKAPATDLNLCDQLVEFFDQSVIATALLKNLDLFLKGAGV
jgi:hypothetical protein